MKYNYQARTKTGEVRSGTVEASSKEAVLALLQKQDLFVTLIEETGRTPIYARSIKFFNRISKKEIVSFFRQLAIMFESKVSLSESLRVLAKQSQNPTFKEKLVKISEEVEAGTALSVALSRHPKAFSSFHVSMIKSGEVSGTLAESFDYLAEHIEKEYQLYSRIRGAMIYPSIILLTTISIFFAMVFLVIPRLSEIVREAGQELPLITQISMGLASFARQWWWAIFLLPILAAFGISSYYKTKEGKKVFDRVFLKFPVLGGLLKMIYLSRFAENLSTLIRGGIPIAQALEITADIAGNNVYKTIILQTREEVRKGGNVSSVLARYPDEFPAVFVQMTMVGEKTGTLGKTLLNVVDFYQKEVERSITNLLGLLEPIMIIIFGLLIGGLMASVLMPLYQMASV